MTGCNRDRLFGRRAPAGPDRQRAFTLIELLLATTLIALIMAMATGGFRASMRASRSAEDVIEETNRLRVVHNFVRRQVSLARPLIIEETEDGQIRFEGERDRVRFIAPMPGYLGFGGPYVQELRIEPGEEGRDLVFAYAVLNGYEPGDLDAEPPVTLIENVGEVTFEYLGFDESGEEVFWDTIWEEPGRMPLAVSIDMALPRDNGLTWPRLTTPVIQDAGASQRPGGPRISTETRASDLLIRSRNRR